MSYLNALRLHFAGQFQATVSTVNNDVRHFDNAKFEPSFQQRGTSQSRNGWWNPNGDGVWRLLGCAIKSAFMGDGSAVPSSDPVLTFSIADSDNSAPAKIVDLDPQQQMVSTIFGLQVRIANATGETLMRGNFAPAAFTELWSKVWSSAGGDMAMGAMWQSVIAVEKWGDVSGSPFLVALRAAAEANSGLLSIKFNVDLYSMAWPDAGQPGNDQFCRGRIVGTIGPASASEPRHFILGRQFTPQLVNNGINAVINYCAGVVDTQRNVLRLDLGNALPVRGDGAVVPLGDLFLQIYVAATGSTVLVGNLPQGVYTAANWYSTTAGIVEFTLNANVLSYIGSNPLQIVLHSSGGSVPVMAQEMLDGLYVRADLFVYRLSPGESKSVTFYATCFGQPYGGQVIALFDNPAGLQGTPAPANTAPGTLDEGVPYIDSNNNTTAPGRIAGIAYPQSVTTGNNGSVVVDITGGDPQNFRSYIDGQIYGIGYGLQNQGFEPGIGPVQSLGNFDGILANPWNFISVLVFDQFTTAQPPTWYGNIQPIFQQYANLYPVMANFIDLGNYAQVKGYARMLRHAFSLPEEDPNAMPVTRDLSPAKRAAILQWLANPIEGTPPQTAPNVKLAAAAPSSSKIAETARLGGKAAALARRFGNR